MSLFDEIQARLKTKAAAAPGGSAQEAALAAFQAKTGKAQASGAGPAASNVGERVAQGAVGAQVAQQQAQVGATADALAQQRTSAQEQAAQAQKDLAAQGQAFAVGQQAQAANAAGTRAATAQAADIQAQSKEQLTTDRLTNGFKQATQQLAADRKVGTDDIFETFRQGTQELAFRKDGLALENAAQQLALSDRQYVDKLQQVGTVQRLSNDLAFKQEAQRLAMGANWDQLTQQADFNIDMNADSRQFEEGVAQMSGPAALAILMQDIDATNKQQIGKGLLDIGIDVGKYEYNKPAAPKPTESLETIDGTDDYEPSAAGGSEVST